MPAIATKNSVGTGHGAFPARPRIEGEPLLKINGIDVLVDGNLYAHTSCTAARSFQRAPGLR